MTTGAVAASRSKNVRQAPNSCSEPTPGLDAQERQERGLDPAPLLLVGDVLASVAATLARVVASSSVSSRPQRPRTISPSAQKLMPSPYAGERPSCHQTVSTRPSRYLRNSQASRRLADARRADDRHEAGPPLAARGVEQVLEQAQLVVAAHERRLEGVGAAAAAALGHDAQCAARPGRATALPLSVCSPAGSNAMAADAARWVASPTSTVPGAAADWSRDAVLTRSPGDHALVGGADGHRRLAGQDAGAAGDAGSQRAHRVDQLERGPDRALGVVLARDRARPRPPSPRRR